MMAKVIWNIANSGSGIVPVTLAGVTPLRKAALRSPSQVPSPLKARL